VSGRGRKQPNRGGKARRAQPAPKKGAGSTRTATAVPPPRRGQVPAGTAARTRTGDTEPVTDVRPRRAPVASPGAERVARRERAERRKRNQRLGVVIGAVALGGAAIGGVIAGMAGGAEPAGGGAGASSSVAAAGTDAVVGPTADPAAATPAAPSVAPMTMTCPVGGGASAVFGHDITVPEPYSVTIVYGDGDKYTNDSAHLGAIFSHTYKKAGTYTVNAVLTNPAGEMASATCDYTWGP
jgi:hypothetical protein